MVYRARRPFQKANARPPRGDHSNGVAPSIRVHDDQQVSHVAQPKSHEPRLVLGAGVFPGQRELIIQHCDRLSETDPVGSQIRSRLREVPLDLHLPSV